MLRIAPVAVAQSQAAATLVTRITGGEPPYLYVIRFKDAVLPQITDTTMEGSVRKTFQLGTLEQGKTAGFTISVTDKANRLALYESTPSEQLNGVKTP